MLFENDGSISDALNYAADIYGDGKVMDAFRLLMSDTDVQRKEQERREIERIAADVKEWKRRRAILGDHGVIPDFRVPYCHYHGYAAGAKLAALDKGVVLPCNGYGIWDDPDFVNWYKRKYPQLCYEEAPRNARIIVNERGKLAAA